jgi:hypothetical protein
MSGYFGKIRVTQRRVLGSVPQDWVFKSLHTLAERNVVRIPKHNTRVYRQRATYAAYVHTETAERWPY